MLKRITQNQLILGEGPMWDAENKLLYYVDIESRKVGRYNPRTGEQVFWETQERVGCIVPDKKGNLISAERNMLVRINPKNGKREIIAHFPIEERLRFNDGKCDCMGRLWIGTMAIEQGTPYAKGCGAL